MILAAMVWATALAVCRLALRPCVVAFREDRERCAIVARPGAALAAIGAAMPLGSRSRSAEALRRHLGEDGRERAPIAWRCELLVAIGGRRWWRRGDRGATWRRPRGDRRGDAAGLALA